MLARYTHLRAEDVGKKLERSYRQRLILIRDRSDIRIHSFSYMSIFIKDFSNRVSQVSHRYISRPITTKRRA